MLVSIVKLSLSTFRWEPTCQGFRHFSVSLRHFVLAKLVTSSIKVKASMLSQLLEVFTYVNIGHNNCTKVTTCFAVPHTSWVLHLTHSCLEIYLTSGVWTYQTSENNLGIKHKFKKILKKSCRFSCDQHFSIKHFLNPSNAETTFIQNTMTQNFWKPSKPCHVGIHWKALAEYSQMSTHLLGFRLFFIFFCIILYRKS